MKLEDKEKLIYLFEQYSNLMMKVAYDILKDKDLSQDAVSTAFIRIMENLQKIDEKECHKTRKYLVIITRNIAIDIYKQRKKTISFELIEKNIENPHMLEEFYAIEQKTDIDNALKKLPIEYADILILELDGFDKKEISNILGISYENVRQRLSRARKALKDILK